LQRKKRVSVLLNNREEKKGRGRRTGVVHCPDQLDGGGDSLASDSALSEFVES
jgi:hypothetical protein